MFAVHKRKTTIAARRVNARGASARTAATATAGHETIFTPMDAARVAAAVIAFAKRTVPVVIRSAAFRAACATMMGGREKHSHAMLAAATNRAAVIAANR